MGLFDYRQNRLLQPTWLARVDYTNTLVRRGLVRAYNFAEYGREVTGNTPTRWAGGNALEPGRVGLGLRVTTTVANSGESPRNLISAGITVVWVAEKLGAIATNSDFLFGDTLTAAGNYNWGLYESVGTGQLAFYLHNGTTAVATAGSAAWATGAGPQVWVGTYGDGDNNVRLYLNGVQQASAAQTGNVRQAASTVVRSGGWSVGNRNHRNYLGLIFNRCLTPGEVAAISANPWQVFQSEKRFEFAGSAVAGQTLLPSLLSAEPTIYAPTVLPGAVTLTPSLVDASPSIFAPTVTLDGGTQTLEPGLLDASPSIFAPTVTATYSLAPSLLTATPALYAPTVTVGAVTLLPPLINAVPVIYAPAVTGGVVQTPARGLRKTRYVPGRVPSELRELSRFLQSEIERITDGLESPFTHQLLEKLSVEPSRKPSGQALICYANGTTFDPGSGEGIYAFYNGSWSKLG